MLQDSAEGKNALCHCEQSMERMLVGSWWKILCICSVLAGPRTSSCTVRGHELPPGSECPFASAARSHPMYDRVRCLRLAGRSEEDGVGLVVVTRMHVGMQGREKSPTPTSKCLLLGRTQNV